MHISLDERDRIAEMKSLGHTVTEIAEALGRSKSTLSRELRRNATPAYRVYLSHRAHERAVARKQEAGSRPRLKNEQVVSRGEIGSHLQMSIIKKQAIGTSRSLNTGVISNAECGVEKATGKVGPMTYFSFPYGYFSFERAFSSSIIKGLRSSVTVCQRISRLISK